MCVVGGAGVLDKKNVENCLVYLSFGVSSTDAKSFPIN